MKSTSCGALRSLQVVGLIDDSLKRMNSRSLFQWQGSENQATEYHKEIMKENFEAVSASKYLQLCRIMRLVYVLPEMFLSGLLPL